MALTPRGAPPRWNRFFPNYWSISLLFFDRLKITENFWEVGVVEVHGAPKKCMLGVIESHFWGVRVVLFFKYLIKASVVGENFGEYESVIFAINVKFEVEAVQPYFVHLCIFWFRSRLEKFHGSCIFNNLKCLIVKITSVRFLGSS